MRAPPWLPRRIGDHDLTWWLKESGFIEATVESLPDPRARLNANVIASGRYGGHDLHLRTLHDMGVGCSATLPASLAGAHFGGRPGAEPRLGRRALLAAARAVLPPRGADGHSEPEVLQLAPLDHDPPKTLDLRSFAAVLSAGGFRPDYASWVHVAGAFDGLGFPIHEEGASVAAPGLYFVGVHFLRKRKSSIFLGVGEDAAIVAGTIAQRGLP